MESLFYQMSNELFPDYSWGSMLNCKWVMTVSNDSKGVERVILSGLGVIIVRLHTTNNFLLTG